MEIKLGDKARDMITGFEGIITAHIKYITGCDQFGLKPAKLNKEGLPIATQWFDIMRLEKITERVSEEKPQGAGVG